MTITPPNTQEYTPVAVPSPNSEVDGLVTAVNVVSVDAQPRLEVVAPATLPEGYTFDAVANGENFAVTVPIGGVAQGQRFSVPFPTGSVDRNSGIAIPRSTGPVGRWKDGLCDCCRHGCCHPMLWNAWCCPFIAAGQVMRRLQLTACGDEGTAAQASKTFRILLGLTIVITIVNFILGGLQSGYDPAELGFDVIGQIQSILQSVALVFSVVIVAKTRRHIRTRYQIPESSCNGCEDCCCAFWCQCCTVAQMARHTADYDTYAGKCCSETGLPDNAPGMSLPAHTSGTETV